MNTVIKLITSMLEPDPTIRPSAQQCFQAISDIIRQEQNNIFFEKDRLSPSALSIVPPNPKSSKIGMDPSIFVTNLENSPKHPHISTKKAGPETLPSFATIMQLDMLENQRPERKVTEQPESLRKMGNNVKASPQNSPVLSQGRFSSTSNQKGLKPVIKVNSQEIDPLAATKRPNNWFAVSDTPKVRARSGLPIETPQFAPLGIHKKISAESGTMPIGSVNPLRIRKVEHKEMQSASAGVRKAVYQPNPPGKEQLETDVTEEDIKTCIPLHAMLGSGGILPQKLAQKKLGTFSNRGILNPFTKRVKPESSWGSLSTQTGDPSMLRSKGSLVHPVVLLDDPPADN